jgi:hypothetical protein
VLCPVRFYVGTRGGGAVFKRRADSKQYALGKEAGAQASFLRHVCVSLTLMRVLIRNTRNGLYLQDPDHWTADPTQAADFGRSARALLFAAEERLTTVEVILAFDDPRYNITLPILDKTPQWPFTPPGR